MLMNVTMKMEAVTAFPDGWDGIAMKRVLQHTGVDTAINFVNARMELVVILWMAAVIVRQDGKANYVMNPVQLDYMVLAVMNPVPVFVPIQIELAIQMMVNVHV